MTSKITRDRNMYDLYAAGLSEQTCAKFWHRMGRLKINKAFAEFSKEVPQLVPRKKAPYEPFVTMVANALLEQGGPVRQQDDENIVVQMIKERQPDLVPPVNGKADPPKRKRKEFSQRDKDIIYKRDGGLCQKCAIQLTPDSCEYDHVIPCHEGGPTEPSNGHCLCKKDHKDKSKFDSLRTKALKELGKQPLNGELPFQPEPQPEPQPSPQQDLLQKVHRLLDATGLPWTLSFSKKE